MIYNIAILTFGCIFVLFKFIHQLYLIVYCDVFILPAFLSYQTLLASSIDFWIECPQSTIK